MEDKYVILGRLIGDFGLPTVVSYHSRGYRIDMCCFAKVFYVSVVTPEKDTNNPLFVSNTYVKENEAYLDAFTFIDKNENDDGFLSLSFTKKGFVPRCE